MATLDGNSDYSDYSLKLNLLKCYVCFIVREAGESSMAVSLHYKLINVYLTDNLKALHTEGENSLSNKLSRAPGYNKHIL